MTCKKCGKMLLGGYCPCADHKLMASMVKYTLFGILIGWITAIAFVLVYVLT